MWVAIFIILIILVIFFFLHWSQENRNEEFNKWISNQDHEISELKTRMQFRQDEIESLKKVIFNLDRQCKGEIEMLNQRLNKHKLVIKKLINERKKKNGRV